MIDAKTAEQRVRRWLLGMLEGHGRERLTTRDEVGDRLPDEDKPVMAAAVERLRTVLGTEVAPGDVDTLAEALHSAGVRARALLNAKDEEIRELRSTIGTALVLADANAGAEDATPRERRQWGVLVKALRSVETA